MVGRQTLRTLLKKLLCSNILKGFSRLNKMDWDTRQDPSQSARKINHADLFGAVMSHDDQVFVQS
jgi:hypothetical protein